MFKKSLVAALAVVMATSALSGCGTKTAKVDGDTSEMTLHMHFFGYCVYDENWPIFQKAAELTGIKLKGTASKSISSSDQAWTTMIASNPLPDIIHGTEAQLDDLGKMGGLIPLEDLIDEHAPNIKKFLEDCPEAKKQATNVDGHIYFIPGSLSGIDKEAITSKGFFIRTDWLDKLGLKAPKTVDELYTVLKAFREKDPNGNGQMDEVPYFVRQEAVTDLYQLFGAFYGWHVKDDGTVSYGMVEEEYRNAIRELARWYKEGLIDKEIFSRGGQARQQLLSQDLGGMTHDWISSTAQIGETYGIGWEAILPPADINGEVKEVRSRALLHGLGWGISKDNKNPIDAIKYLDFWLSEEGRNLNAFGVEGVHHDIVDGQRVFNEEVLSSPDGVPTYMRNQGQVEIGTIGSIQAEYQGMTESGKRGFDLYENSGIVRKEGVDFTFTEEEDDEVGKTIEDIYTYCDEMEQKWILGVSDIDADWDAYIATVKKFGYDRILEVYNTAYKRALGE